MAEKCVESLQPEIGRELCLVKGKNGEFLGYKRDILIENLSERENTMFVCIRCQGIMREVCTSNRGEQFCSCCKKEGEQANLNLQMDSMILSFKCSCPLIARGCGWVGALGGCQDHLDTCGYVYETCKLRCGVVLQRNELKVHEKENCTQHIVECKHCRQDFKSCELTNHLGVCPRMKVSCELGCDVIVCREDITQHLEVDCPEKELECPFAKYKCEMRLIKRKNMSKHLEEKRIEHLELKINSMEESEIIAKQKISEQSAMIETMSQEFKSLNKKMQHLCCQKNDLISQEIKSLNKKMQIIQCINHIPIKLEWRITELPDFKSNIKETFLVAGYHLEFELCRYYTFSGWILIKIRPLTGWYYEELKWPFKAKFITHLKSQLNPKDTNEYKSEIIIMEKKDFNSDSNKSSVIAHFSEDDFLEDYHFDGAADIEVIVIFL